MMKSSTSYNSAIVNLNVGGTRFSTSKETLTWIPDSFFSSLLSGRIPSHRDDSGAIFVDRDPKYFAVILAFLRTRELDVKNVDFESLKREAEFYGITPIVSRLSVCAELNHSGCGDDLFHGIIDFPNFPQPLDNTIKKLDLPNHNTSQVNYEGACELVPDNRKVLIITGHNSWIAVAYKHNVVCYKMKENFGWHQVFATPHLEFMVERIAINAKVQGMAPDAKSRMIAVAFNNQIRLWSFQDENNSTEIGTFNLQASVDALFFIGSQLVATSDRGRVGVWNAVSQHWQAQDVVPITSYDTAGSFLLLGGQNGGIYYIDMQKFPLRLKDNDLLITELYHDSGNEAITALSVYLTPKTSATVGHWIEVAYGTVRGAVRVIVQHPELVGQGFQLFQTFTVHRNSVTRVMLSEKFLVSVCGDNNHVRTWNVTRFRGMISTQPGSTPVASFKVLAIEADTDYGFVHPNDIGPHGEREEEQVFIQKVVPVSTQLYVRTSSTGKRIATIHSVDSSIITCFCLHECEGSTRMGSRPRRYLFTGHSNGNIQIWDMTTALAKAQSSKVFQGGPTEFELLELLNHCEVSACGSTATPLPLATSLLDRVLLRSSMTSLDSFHSNSSTGTIKRYSQPPHKKETSPVPEEDNKESKSIATPLSYYENLTSNSSQKQTVKIKSDTDSHTPVARATSFSMSPHSPVGGMPLPGMTFPLDVTNDKKVKKSSNKNKHTRSHSFSEHQYVDTSSVSVRRQFSLKMTEKSQSPTETVTRSNSYAHPLKKKLSCEDKKSSGVIPEGTLTPRNSTARNSYKSAMQQEIQSTSRKPEKHKDEKVE